MSSPAHQWEYLILRLPDSEDDAGIETLLNEAGRLRWELVSLRAGLAYLKRPR